MNQKDGKNNSYFMNRFLLLSVAFIITTIVLVKFAPVFFGKQMTETVTISSDEMDKRFLNEMIEHHMGAVSMAREALEKSERSQLRDLSQLIVSDQEKEIDQMYKWKKEWFSDEGHVSMGTGSHSKSMTSELGKADKNFDLRFIEAMITHHTGAIEMAEKVMVPTDRKEIHDFAKRIIEAQTKEIEIMKLWRKEWYGK